MSKINPDNFFIFDLPTGKISYASSSDNAIVIPVEALREFVKIQTQPQTERHKSFYNLGTCVGKYFGNILFNIYEGKGMEMNISPEQFLNELNAIMSLHGLGLISIETWGDVLIFCWEKIVSDSIMTSDFQEGILAGILKSFSRKDFEVTSIENGHGKRGKFLAGNPQMVKSARQWAEEGAKIGEIVNRLKSGLHLR